MPVYVYQGLNSGQTFSLEQRISEAALTHHPETGEPVKRLIGKPAIAFKGSGFYANDSKGSRNSSGSKESSSEAKPAESKTESASSTSSESKPAEVFAVKD
ncbi:MAG: FmdB family zinc ribbon protein [Deinococcales bacterium]